MVLSSAIETAEMYSRVTSSSAVAASQGDRATLPAIEYFAKSLKSFEIQQLL